MVRSRAHEPNSIAACALRCTDFAVALICYLGSAGLLEIHTDAEGVITTGSTGYLKSQLGLFRINVMVRCTLLAIGLGVVSYRSRMRVHGGAWLLACTVVYTVAIVFVALFAFVTMITFLNRFIGFRTEAFEALLTTNAKSCVHQSPGYPEALCKSLPTSTLLDKLTAIFHPRDGCLQDSMSLTLGVALAHTPSRCITVDEGRLHEIHMWAQTHFPA